MHGEVRLEVGPASRLTVRTADGAVRVTCQVWCAGALVAWGELRRGVPTSWWLPASPLTITLTADGSEIARREVVVRERQDCEVVFPFE
jgi:hypothetical protein